MSIKFSTSGLTNEIPIDFSFREFHAQPIAQDGLNLIKTLTPVQSGKTKDSWSSSFKKTSRRVDISLENSNLTKDGVPIVALIMNGHGTKQGTYIPANDFVTPVLEKMERDIDKELERLIDGI